MIDYDILAELQYFFLIILCILLQVYAYNEKILQGSIQPSLVDMFVDVAKTFDNKVR